MKLIFPQDEHAPVILGDGVTTVGSAADCDLRLEIEGVAAHHCEIDIRGNLATVTALDAHAPTVLNGRQVAATSEVAVGDLLLFGRVGCRLVGVAASVARSEAPGVPGAAIDSEGHTVLRRAVPKFMLRGVSGITFGKTFALAGSMIVGRQNDCDIAVPADEVSRKHVRLTVQAGGVMVEDLGSANGTYINDKRVQSAVLGLGDELRLDTVRFQLSAPGSAAPTQAASSAARPAASTGGNFALWLSVGIIVAALVAVAALHFSGFL